MGSSLPDHLAQEIDSRAQAISEDKPRVMTIQRVIVTWKGRILPYLIDFVGFVVLA